MPKTPRIAVDATATEPLTADEYTRLLAAATEPYLHALIQLMRYSGLVPAQRRGFPMLYSNFKPIAKSRWSVVSRGARIAEIALTPDGRGAVTPERELSREETASITEFIKQLDSEAKNSKAYGRDLAKMIL